MAETLNLNWQMQSAVPALISGADAEKLYNSLPKQAKAGLRYDRESESVISSTALAVPCFDTEAQKYGARCPSLIDLSRPEVMKIAQGKHYIDSRAWVVRSREDTNYPKNNSLLTTIYELAEKTEGSIKEPFMIEGFNLIPNSEDNGYGLTLVARSDFKVIQDERFGGKYDRRKFSEVDELGIPNFDRGGNRTWYTRDLGLSRLCLDWDFES